MSPEVPRRDLRVDGVDEVVVDAGVGKPTAQHAGRHAHRVPPSGVSNFQAVRVAIVSSSDVGIAVVANLGTAHGDGFTPTG